MIATTIHNEARKLIGIYLGKGGGAGRLRGCKREQRKRELVQEAIERAGQLNTEHLARDFRPGVGSGRAAEWCLPVYRNYVCIARTLHDDLGWSGDDVRRAAKAVANAPNVGMHLKGVRPLPDSACGGLMGRIRADGRWDAEPGSRAERLLRLLGGSVPDPDRIGGVWTWEWAASFPGRSGARVEGVERLCWMAYNELVTGPAIGRMVLDEIVEDMRKHTRRAPAMAIGAIRKARGLRDGIDYRGCSGCEWIRALLKRPDLWDEMLALAPAPRHFTAKNGCECYEVPFGLEAPADFTHCLVLGLSSEIRCRPEDAERLRRAALGLDEVPA